MKWWSVCLAGSWCKIAEGSSRGQAEESRRKHECGSDFGGFDTSWTGSLGRTSVWVMLRLSLEAFSQHIDPIEDQLLRLTSVTARLVAP